MRKKQKGFYEFVPPLLLFLLLQFYHFIQTISEHASNTITNHHLERTTFNIYSGMVILFK